MMAPGSIEMSLQQEERQPEEGRQLGCWRQAGIQRGLEWGWRVEDPPERGKYWTFIPAGLQVAVLGQGCKGALASWKVFAVLMEPRWWGCGWE